MIPMLSISLLIVASLNAHAEFPYEALSAYQYQPNPKVSFEVTHMTPTKSQDGIGLCYGFSSTTLLENYRCRELNLNCLETAQQLSPLDVSSYYLNRGQKSIQEAGHAGTLLTNLRNSNRKIAKEDCAKYSSLVRKSNPNFIADEGQGWKFLVDAWNKFKLKNQKQQKDQVGCLVSNVKSSMKVLRTPAAQLEDAFLNADSLENFLYKAILPLECLRDDQLSSIPDFAINSYPKYGEKYNEKDLANKVESVLLNNIPIEMSICTKESSPGNCPEGEGHSITLSGIREVCSQITEDCRTMVRVKNSYGWGWQRDNNDGWLDLGTLAKASMGLGNFSNITWIQKPGSVLENKKLIRSGVKSSNGAGKDLSVVELFEKHGSSAPKTIPAQYKNFKGIWKCRGNSYLDHYEDGCVPHLKF